VIGLVGLYILFILTLLPLIPSAELSEEVSPMVAALSRWGMGWAGTAINFILVTAILSTMMASMFGLGRMMRSVADEGHAPKWLKDEKDVPYRGIIFSGVGMLLGLGAGLFFPRVYLFLISAGGFATLFTYAAILATHIRFRKCNGCPPSGKCQMPGYPYTSWIALISIIVVIISMPFISGQTSGLIAGIIMTVLYAGIYMIMWLIDREKTTKTTVVGFNHRKYKARFSQEMSEDLTQTKKVAPDNKETKCSNQEQSNVESQDNNHK
jgi:L-asparagine transporter-like permease